MIDYIYNNKVVWIIFCILFITIFYLIEKKIIKKFKKFKKTVDKKKK